MRKLLLNQLKLIAKENLMMLIPFVLAKISLQKSEAQIGSFVHPGIPFIRPGLNQLKVNISREGLSAYSAFKNDSLSKLTVIREAFSA